ncbi:MULTISPECIES: 50S ribosomal protein L6 [Methylobacterium]|jgi:large subunit ribosomal protein L6|uniref:50S ribosomal protein L6 n=1 Tax=Methylobacterium TaxID=407 RepID=UPI0011C1F1DD|nr:MULTISPECIES: 50S ribosomal protein L6 [Methylobacterium]QEE38350.1 50S ribosomal protein L6 [Methylobacterium sp. WL1]TXM99973.1 50S ribosomal protein L6 [Methylobacterium sp. WL64]TXN43079.1 50S ribosomal protein L6 [Methylobacterium sp. WL7]TXN54934.1 50S ribosomal protein L6 [Methylobacterium sp. WL2]GJE24678.1 50S ribosomal protein L6 [Methylobacterium mesophilicum]
MSRVGKKPVPVPAGVTATVTGQTVKMKGSKGELQFDVPTLVSVEMKDGAISVEPINQSKPARSLWGTSRAQIANIAEGVSKGFEKKLEITGVGYRAAMAGKALKLSLGYSHDIEYAIPAGITIVTPKPTEITITGINRQQVGQVAAEIRDYRGPEPYKGKGVKYAGEFIFRKEGKKK